MTGADEPTQVPAVGTSAHQTLGRFLAAYRGQLPREEAARRSGLSEQRWIEIETGSVAGGPTVPAYTVAAMCAAVGADIGTGLKLAGHDPRAYDYLLNAPPGLMPVRSPLSPHIALVRAIADLAASPRADTGRRIAAHYRDVARANQRLADRIQQESPDERADYWAGYAAALRAVAEQQTHMADEENNSARGS